MKFYGGGYTIGELLAAPYAEFRALTEYRNEYVKAAKAERGRG